MSDALRRPVPPTVKGWCPGALRPMASGDGLIVRLRITGGIVPADRLAAVAALARRHGNGLVDLSQRANLQIRGVRDHALPALQDALAALGLLDADPAVEAVRNIIPPPLAGHAPAPAPVDGLALVRALEAGLAADPRLHALPDKVGFLVDDGGPVSLAAVAADIRLDARPDRRIRLALGGTADDAAEAATVAPSDAPAAALALARAFLALRSRTTPPARRLRDLVHTIPMPDILREAGLDPSPQGKVVAERPEGVVFAPSSRRAGPALLGAHPGFLGLGAPFGRLTADQLDRLAALAPSGVRLTPFRLVLLPDADATLLPAFAAAGLVTGPDDARLAVVACPGAPACPSGAAETRDAAAALAPLARRLAPACVALHVSGCPKGCARPEPTAAVLVGAGGLYDLVLGGRADAPPVRTGLDLSGAEEALRQLTPPQGARP